MRITYEYTDRKHYRVYRSWDRDNKCLKIIRLRDTKAGFISYEIWESPVFCPDEDEAAKALQYKDSGMYGHSFVDCLRDCLDQHRVTITDPTKEYELEEDRWEREEKARSDDKISTKEDGKVEDNKIY